MSNNAALVASSQLNATSSPLQSTSISVGTTAESYVLSLACLDGKYAAMSSSPSASSSNLKADAPACPIHLFSKHTLHKTLSFPGHEVASTFMRSVNSIAALTGPVLVSSGKDGSVKVWDERSGSHGIKMTDLGKSRTILSFDVSSDGYTVAAGTELQGEDALVLYWDPRQPAAPLRTHSSTHSDDITVVQFSADRPGALLTASSDGLISLSNPDEPDEDEAVLHMANWGCSISQAGWMPDEKRIWAASDMETFSTWSEELDLLQTHDIRAPSLHSGPRTWVTDYFITTSRAGGHLGVFVGSNEGDVALLSNSDLSTPQRSNPNAGTEWTLHQLWSMGHEGVVRSLSWDEQDQVLVTGGEDGKIHVWPGLSPIENGLGEKDEGDAMDVDVDSEPSSGKSTKRGREKDMDWDVQSDGDSDTKGKNGKRLKR